MYSKTITARAIEAQNRAIYDLAQASAQTPWELERHSPSVIAAAIAHFADLRNDQGDLTRPLTQDERQFIQNERYLCALDFDYYGNYAKIIDWRKQSVAFRPNIAQQIVLDVWGQLEERALAISMQQLKARQLGVSTLTEIGVAHRVQFHTRTNAIVASASPEQSTKVAKMIAYCWANMPWWLMPTPTKIHQAMPAEFGEINTSLSIQAGNQFTGLGRGDTPNCVHLTELCEWPDPEDKVDASLLRAMHETPDIFLILESTALGRGNWWHKTWKQSKRDWDLGRSRLCPVFLPWFVGVDIYPTPTWLRARPVPPAWIPHDLTIKHAERARSYVMANPLLFKYVACGDRDWQLPLEQLWFYEVERDIAISKNVLNKFLAEMPADDLEAFQSTKTSAISSEVLLTYREAIKEPEGVYTIIGDGIPDALTISRRNWDFSKPPITIHCNKLLPRASEVYQLVPIRFDGYADTEPGVRCFIYEHPRDLETYGLGVDTADGVGLDSSCIEVARLGQLQHRDAQVAEFNSAYIKANQLWPMALALGTYYSTVSARVGKRVPCRVAVECRGNGDIVQLEMKKRGWSNFHPWLHYDNKKFPQIKNANKEGVYTNQAFRSQMMDLMLTLIDEEGLLIRSPWMVDEMEALERDETRQRLQAAYGEHDDRFMALGFVLFSLHVLDIPNRDFSKRNRSLLPYEQEAAGDDHAAFATFPQPIQASSTFLNRGRVPLERVASSYGPMGRMPTNQVRLGRYRVNPIGRERKS